jgi:hypothetical protein
MSNTHWMQRRMWNGARRVAKASGERPRRKRLADMTPELRAVHEVRTVQDRARKAEALAAMTDSSARRTRRHGATRRRRAVASGLVVARVRAPCSTRTRIRCAYPGTWPLADREPMVPQTEATMRGVQLGYFARHNGARRLILLREWNGLPRILRTLAFVENGRPVRSRGDTICRAPARARPMTARAAPSILATTPGADGPPGAAASKAECRRPRAATARSG